MGHWLSVDPSASKIPNESPYVSFGNNPIINIDPDGKFKVPIHEKIIQDAFKSLGFDRFAHMAAWTWQQTWDAADAMNDNTHFDNKFTARDVYKRWASLSKEIQNVKLGNENDILTHNGTDDDIKLGKVLHTVQDFYAHSNYVELYVDYYQKNHNGDIPKPDGIPIYDDGIKDTKFKNEYLDVNLKTGAFDVPKWIVGQDKKSANKQGHMHHDELNKDNESTSEGKKIVNNRISLHKYARQTAYKHTRKILEEKKK